MMHLEDLKIIGMDSNRPPLIKNVPYIDLVFTLSEKASESWCKNFNALFSKDENKASINLKNSIYIESWVKTMDKIPGHLDMLKIKVNECNEIHKLEQKAIAEATSNKNKSSKEEQGPQGQLNKIISQLDFS